MILDRNLQMRISPRCLAKLMTIPVLLLAATLVSLGTDAAENPGFHVPNGFEVSLYADDSLTHDIFSMTIDSRGQVVVAGHQDARGYESRRQS